METAIVKIRTSYIRYAQTKVQQEIQARLIRRWAQSKEDMVHITAIIRQSANTAL